MRMIEKQPRGWTTCASSSLSGSSPSTRWHINSSHLSLLVRRSCMYPPFALTPPRFCSPLRSRHWATALMPIARGSLVSSSWFSLSLLALAPTAIIICFTSIRWSIASHSNYYYRVQGLKAGLLQQSHYYYSPRGDAESWVCGRWRIDWVWREAGGV